MTRPGRALALAALAAAALAAVLAVAVAAASQEPPPLRPPQSFDAESLLWGAHKDYTRGRDAVRRLDAGYLELSDDDGAPAPVPLSEGK
jgi:Spy/CpxP family protein refolding chaperone